MSSETPEATSSSPLGDAAAEAFKLFVGQIPRTMEVDDVRALFTEFGPILDVTVLRDRFSGVHKGCAFVTFAGKEFANQAIQKLHEKKSLPGMAHPMQVKLADSDEKAESRKLFVASLPKTMVEDQLRLHFEPFGDIEDVAIIKTKEGLSKGCGFVKFKKREHALAAIEKLHGNVTVEGATTPLVVKFADTEREKQQKRVAKQFGWHGPTLFPPGLPYSAYGQYPFPLYQPNHLQNQMTAPGPPPSPYFLAQELYRARANVAAQRQSYPMGPDGANLFIYHLPQEFGDHDLLAVFSPFGPIVSSRVFIDKATQQSKCFGFVSYDNPQSAQAAIAAMNGCEIGTKRLKVQLKRSKDVPSGF